MKKNDRNDGGLGERREEIVVSACLLGVKCRYDGGSKPSPEVRKYLKDYTVIPVCPETFGGLERPRPAAELNGCTGLDILRGRGRVVDRNGVDVTDRFISGARKTLDAVRKSGARKAILKSRSPSCGTRLIHDGTFSGETREGMGVAAALLAENGIELLCEDDIVDSGQSRAGKEK